MSGTMVFDCFDRGSCLDIFSFTQFSSRRVYKFGASAIMDKSNKSQRQTCDQDMSSTFYPVASEKSMDEILVPTTQKPGKWKNKKRVTFAKSLYIVVQFLEGYTMSLCSCIKCYI